MRTWGRVLTDPTNPDGPREWRKIETDAKGFNDYVYVTTLVQCLQLNLGESPFYADHGIPAKNSVVQQIFPTFNVMRTQSQFAQFFASLVISPVNDPSPKYNVNVTTHQGVKMAAEVPV